MVFARHQEKLDQIDNEKNMTKMILHGVSIPDIYKVQKGPARDTLIKAAVSSLLDGIVALQQNEDEPFRYTIKQPPETGHRSQAGISGRGQLLQEGVRHLVQVLGNDKADPRDAPGTRHYRIGDQGDKNQDRDP